MIFAIDWKNPITFLQSHLPTQEQWIKIAYEVNEIVISFLKATAIAALVFTLGNSVLNLVPISFVQTLAIGTVMIVSSMCFAVFLSMFSQKTKHKKLSKKEESQAKEATETPMQAEMGPKTTHGPSASDISVITSSPLSGPKGLLKKNGGVLDNSCYNAALQIIFSSDVTKNYLIALLGKGTSLEDEKIKNLCEHALKVFREIEDSSLGSSSKAIDTTAIRTLLETLFPETFQSSHKIPSNEKHETGVILQALFDSLPEKLNDYAGKEYAAHFSEMISVDVATEKECVSPPKKEPSSNLLNEGKTLRENHCCIIELPLKGENITMEALFEQFLSETIAPPPTNLSELDILFLGDGLQKEYFFERKGDKIYSYRIKTIERAFTTSPPFLLFKIPYFYENRLSLNHNGQPQVIRTILKKEVKISEIPFNYKLKTEEGFSSPYELTSFSVHEGVNFLSGHDLTYVNKEGVWYRCDDKEISVVAKGEIERLLSTEERSSSCTISNLLYLPPSPPSPPPLSPIPSVASEGDEEAPSD